jgi:hypothetical protein
MVRVIFSSVDIFHRRYLKFRSLVNLSTDFRLLLTYPNKTQRAVLNGFSRLGVKLAPRREVAT